MVQDCEQVSDSGKLATYAKARSVSIQLVLATEIRQDCLKLSNDDLLNCRFLQMCGKSHGALLFMISNWLNFLRAVRLLLKYLPFAK